MNSGVKLMVGAVVVFVSIGYLAFLGAATSWQYYLSVDEAVADAALFEGRRLRISGRVAAGSLSISDDRQHATFTLADDRSTLYAMCNCLLPDNLAEGFDVVVEGMLKGDVIHVDKVITRCASKYEPADSMADGDEADPPQVRDH